MGLPERSPRRETGAPSRIAPPGSDTLTTARRRAAPAWSVARSERMQLARPGATALIAVLFAVLLAACGGGGGSGDNNTQIPGAPVDRPPSFTSASAATVPEGTIGVFYTATATD